MGNYGPSHLSLKPHISERETEKRGTEANMDKERDPYPDPYDIWEGFDDTGGRNEKKVEEEGYCKICGEHLPRPKYPAGRQRRYCSDKCRKRAERRRNNVTI